MSSQKTTNYNLHKWVGTDYVKREEFNENFDSIDATMKSIDTEAKSKAPSSHVGSGGSAHAAATTTVAGFMSAADKVKLNGVAAGAEVNQNTFANVKVGATTIAADMKQDTLELIAGTNISLTPDATNDRVTIATTGVETPSGAQAKATAAENAAKSYTDTKVAGINIPVTSVAGKTGAVTLTATDVGATPSSHVGSGGAAHANATTTVDGFMSAADKVKINGIATGAEVNQNAFTTVKVGATNVVADSKTDVLELAAGTNVILTPDATNDKITISLNSEVETTAGAQSKATAAENNAKAYAMNMVASGSTADPNTTQEAYILTNHANSPGAGLYWHIQTYFYSSKTSNKGQLAVSYNSSTPRMFIRSVYNSVWTSWVEVESIAGAKAQLDTHVNDGTVHITSTERTKLAGIATGANNYVHPTTAGNKHIPAGGAAGQYLKYSSSGTAVWADIASTGTGISITDSGNYFTSNNVEGALQEIGQTLNGVRGNLIQSVNKLLTM